MLGAFFIQKVHSNRCILYTEVVEFFFSPEGLVISDLTVSGSDLQMHVFERFSFAMISFVTPSEM